MATVFPTHDIPGFELLYPLMPDFTWACFAGLRGFRFAVQAADAQPGNPCLDIDFVLPLAKQTVLVTVHFSQVSNLRLGCDYAPQLGYCQLAGIMVDDKKPDGWQTEQRYHIYSYEDDLFQFTCANLAIVAVAQAELPF